VTAANQASADFVVRNAKIYTVDRRTPWARAVAVKDGKFAAVGSDAEIESAIGEKTEVFDAKGRLILPGLFDSHCHAFEGARANLFEIRLSPVDGIEQIVEKVKEASKQKGGVWLKGAGWSLQKLTELSAASSLARFDEVTGDRPAVLRDSSHHAMFSNSAAMKVAGITRDTADVRNGTIVRYQNGSPSGIFLEEACSLIDKSIPPLSEDEKRRVALHAVSLYNSLGVTGFTYALASEMTMRAFKDLEDAGKLSIWIATCIATDSILTPERDGVGAEVIARRSAYRSEHIAVDFVKFFMDGVPGARTAAFHDPYLATPDGKTHHAESFHGVAELCDLIAPLDREGIHVKVHAVGDQAIRDTLDAIEKVRKLNGQSGPQHSIAHLGYVFDDDIPRLTRLNVLADLCPPLWFPNRILHNNTAVLGDERGKRAWPTGDIVRSGAASAFGTDWPIVASPSPWPGLSSLITRKDPTGVVGGVFRADQAITLEEALPLCTINVADSMGFGRRTGSISQGKGADFIVLDRDLFAIPPEEIAGTEVLRTYFAGRLVHDADR
jgi:predicted amidohydrolase YtcJ